MNTINLYLGVSKVRTSRLRLVFFIRKGVIIMIKSWKVEELVSIIKRSDNPTEIADSVSQLVDLAQEEGLSVKDYVQTALVLQSTKTKF